MGKFGFLILLIPALLAGCGKDNNSNSNVQEGAAGGDLVVTVAPGNPASRPLYLWTDITGTAVNAATITVARTTDLNTIVWGIATNTNTDALQSPWQQGSLSTIVTPIVQTEVDLQTNVTYRVTVTKADNQTSGYHEFTLLP
ncbi:MAG TPA: hypothetical protein VLY20_03035 [Nitrospiria bacterium]|nr:hypothetical protein [Nitrospiria bacterium]HUK55613.1 hypothetical protein [Nitrospiria bacterium]